MRRIYLAILLLLFVLACNAEKDEKQGLIDRDAMVDIVFDKTKWRIKEGLAYPYRDQMLNSIVYNDTVRALNKDEVLDLFGEPDRRNDGHLYYMISQRRLGFWPLHTKTMVVKLSENNTIDWIKIHE